jgi:HEAT repeat protein
VGIGLILCALPLLHPFIRQSLVGPTIEGIPWCVWEDEFRRQVHGNQKKAWFYQALEKLGLGNSGGMPIDPFMSAAYPLHVSLADDSDVKVRRAALGILMFRSEKREAAVGPVFRRHLHDDDKTCRLLAARGAWLAQKDAEAKPVSFALLGDGDRDVRFNAISNLALMAPETPDLFETLAKLAGDADPLMRSQAMGSMGHFGKRGVAILRDGLKDPTANVRTNAIYAAYHATKAGVDMTPELLAMQHDADWSNRRSAANWLHQLDPKRFPQSPNEVD